MRDFAALLDRLVLTPQRNVKLKLLGDYFRSTPDPDRGYALAALTGELDVPSVKPAMLRNLVIARIDEVLFHYSYDYVGDLAETIALIWPEPRPDVGWAKRSVPTGFASGGHDVVASGGHGAGAPLPTLQPRLRDVVEQVMRASRLEGPRLVEGWLDALDATGRWALIKLVTGGLRIGVSARLTKQALADLAGRQVNEIEEVWHGLSPPYAELFAWLEGRGERPSPKVIAPFRPVMLSHALDDDELALITPEAYAAEWKWDGIRVQAVREGDRSRLYSRTGDDVSGAFPDLVDGLDFEGAIDGELLVGRRADAGYTVGKLQRFAAAAESQDRDGQAYGELSGLHPRLRLPDRRAAKTCAGSPSYAGANAWKAWSRVRARTGSTSRRSCPSRAARNSRPSARRRPSRKSRA